MSSIKVQCICGRTLKARAAFAGKRATCPSCGDQVTIPVQVTPPALPSSKKNQEDDDWWEEPMVITEFLDPPGEAMEIEFDEEPVEPKEPIMRRMFEAMLDPRSIQWMLMIGGGLLVIGLIVLLINWLDVKTPYIIASAMGVGTLLTLAGGWYLTLKTKYKVASRALTFLACVVAPLNLWYYHAQGIVTLENHLWVGGVICSLMYIATVRLLRDPLFMYAVEVGITLTVLLFLPIINVTVDATTLSITFLVMGAISIHAERLFAASSEEFPRQQYGMPLFWAGQVQTAFALVVLFGSQTLSWLDKPLTTLFGKGFQGNLLTDQHFLAGFLWLIGTYLYLYSDVVVRRIGLYIYLAAFCLLMAIVTIVGSQFDQPELVIIALAVVGLGTNMIRSKVIKPDDQLMRVTAPIGLILSGIPLLIGWLLFIRSNSGDIWGETFSVEVMFVVAMLVVTISNRISAYLCREKSLKQTAIYLFFSAAGLLLAAAGALPLMKVTLWYQQAPLLMLIPLGYILASRYWRGRLLERPLGWVAHAATAIILVHVLFATMQETAMTQEIGLLFRPMKDQMQSLLLGLVFAQASLFYALAGLFRRRSVNAYFSALAACCALWQWLGYFGVETHFHTLLYAMLGLITLIVSRSLGIQYEIVYNNRGEKSRALRGRGQTAFQCGNAILSIALLSAFWQGMIRLVNGNPTWIENSILLMTTATSVVAAWMVPKGAWRRIYSSAAIVLTGLSVITITLEWLKDLNLGEKVELIAVVTGIGLLIASYIARFREKEERNDLVDVGLLMGSLLAAAPLLMAVIYHRWWGDGISMVDEIGLLAVTIIMLVSGISWQAKAPTLIGGGCLGLYLIIMIVEIAQRAHEMVGIAIFMTIVGGVVFALGVALSIYREKLLALPDKIANREGVFNIMTWR